MKTIAIANQKGGVGKTSMACHLGFYAAKTGLRVLMVDFDEGDLSELFLPEDAGRETQEGILHSSDLFADTRPEGKGPLAVGQGISLIPSDPLLVDVDDLPLPTAAKPKEALQGLAADYDLCIIDTPPNLQRRFVAALIAADYALSPIDIGPFTVDRIPKMEKTMSGIKVINPNLHHLGYLPTKVYSLSQVEQRAISQMQNALGDRFINTPIYIRACIPVALAGKRPVWANVGKKEASGSQKQAGREYRRACREVFDRMGL